MTYLGVMLKEGRDCYGEGAQAMMEHIVCYGLCQNAWHKTLQQH